MFYYNFINLRKKRTKHGILLIKFIGLVFIFLFLLSFIPLNKPIVQAIDVNEINKFEDDKASEKNQDFPNLAADASILQNPFTKNFSDISNFFLEKYESNLDYNVSIYFRYGNDTGVIIDNTTFSEDNLYIYKSLLKQEFDAVETYTAYNNLRETSLWHEGNLTRNKYEYGFIKSINGTTGEIINDTRYLSDNLVPIFLLIEEINDPSINGSGPIKYIEEIFELINSSEFWNETLKGFSRSNSSNNKYTEGNLYAIMANLLINRTTQLSPTIRNQAYNLANQTMSALIENMWDNNNHGFKYNSTEIWGVGGSDKKYLRVNALGIITFLEFWRENGSIDSPYLKNATLLYDTLNEHLWDPVNRAYNYSASADWTGVSNTHDLESNAIMMSACLMLFDITGNITYYDRAIELYNTFESRFYDGVNKAYRTAINPVIDNNKDLQANMKLIDAYYSALDIYENAFLTVSFNASGDIPDLIINQDVLKITCNYTYESVLKNHYITDANITYIFKYPNDTLLISYEVHIYPNVTAGWVAEKTKVTCFPDLNGALNGTYFNITTLSTKFYVWFDVNDSGSTTHDPTFSDRIRIKIYNISTNATKEQVASNITAVLQEYNSNFSVLVTGENVTITNVELGVVENVIDGAFPDATNFTFTIINEGANRTVTEHMLLFPINECLPLEEGYSVHIYANKSNFCVAYAIKQFNVISGLQSGAIDGLDPSMNQGQTLLITLPVSSTRNSNITLNASLEAEGFINQERRIEFSSTEDTLVSFNLTAINDAAPGSHVLYFTIKNGTIPYLKVIETIIVDTALSYENLLYSSKAIRGGEIKVSMKLINLLPENSQSLNLSFTGDYTADVLSEITLDGDEERLVSFSIPVSKNVAHDSIEVVMTTSKNDTIIFTYTLNIEILPKYEIISSTFPDKISQGEAAYLIIIIQNNQESSENFTLYLNGKAVTTNIDFLAPGENRIVKEIVTTINPYEFGKKNYKITLKDSAGDILTHYYFEVELELSAFSLVFFYIVPLIVPTAIVLYYKNKDIKNKLLRR